MCCALYSVDSALWNGTFYQTAEGALHLFHFYLDFSMAMYHHQCASSGCICRWTCWFSHSKLAHFPIIRSVGVCSRDHLLIIRWSFPQIFPLEIWYTCTRLTFKWSLGDFRQKNWGKTIYVGKKLRSANCCEPWIVRGQIFHSFPLFPVFQLVLPDLFFSPEIATASALLAAGAASNQQTIKYGIYQHITYLSPTVWCGVLFQAGLLYSKENAKAADFSKVCPK